MRSSHGNRDDTGFFGRIVVPAREQCVANEKPFLYSSAENVSQLPYSVTFVDAMLGDINGCRTAHLNGKPGNQRIENLLDLLSLAEIRVPFAFLLERRLLA